MKANAAVLIVASALLASCAPEAGARGRQPGAVEAATAMADRELSATQGAIGAEQTQMAEVATGTPTENSSSCVVLLAPADGAEVPPVGKVDFSWTRIAEAGKYVLIVISPSGSVVPLETDKTTLGRYMEAFAMGGEYQWQVIAQRTDGSQICASERTTFHKAQYQQPGRAGRNGGTNGSKGGGGTDSCQSDPDSCGGGGQH